MFKTFKQYLAESTKTFTYVVKVAGEFDKQVTASFTKEIEQYQARIVSTRQTNVQKEPFGFPHLKNESVFVAKIESTYPITDQQFATCAKRCGIPENRFHVSTEDFNATMNNNEYNPEFANDTKTANEKGEALSKEYASSFTDRVKKSDIDYGAPKPTTDVPQNVIPKENTKSVFSGDNRGPKPETFSTKRNA